MDAATLICDKYKVRGTMRPIPPRGKSGCCLRRKSRSHNQDIQRSTSHNPVKRIIQSCGLKPFYYRDMPATRLNMCLERWLDETTTMARTKAGKSRVPVQLQV